MIKQIKDIFFNLRLFYSLFLVFFLVLSSYFVLPVNTHAQEFCPLQGDIPKPKEVKSLETFKKIPILEEGRVKPLDTYGRSLLLQFSGKNSFNKEEAIHFLARLLFAPETTREDKIFLINNPAIPEALGIETDKKRRYSFVQLEPHLDKLQELAAAADHIEEKQRDIVENELIRLYKNIELYAGLSLNFTFTLPDPDFTISDPQNLSALGLQQGQLLSFLDLALKADLLNKLAQPLSLGGSENWNASQKETFTVMQNLFRWGESYQNLPLTIIPASMPGDERWYSPWDAISQNFQNEQCRLEITSLSDLFLAYWDGDQLKFDLAAKGFTQSVTKRVNEKNSKTLEHISLEVFSNRLGLFTFAKIFYLLAFFAFLFSFVATKPVFRLSAFFLVILGFAIHSSGLILRILILRRPPVSNLYETFIFVGFIGVLAGIIIELIQKQWLGILVSGVCGFILLTIAGKFAMEGDTLKMLVAVLNSNFWLSTHVLSITTGYAGVCVAGVIGHIYILQNIFKARDKKLLDSTYKILLGALGFGLTMTFLGTNLGGIWADQSWGRFWGWDPKENGALLIILWCAILFHAKIAKIIGPLGLAVGSALGIVVVMWAWFGVNLLSVGLHSYGFTSGIAVNLAVYVVLQILFLAVAYPLAKRRAGSGKY